MKLQGKVALVTGSGRGIGSEIALAYAEEGADIIVTARTSSEIEEVAEKVIKLGRKALPVPCDVSKEEEVKNLVQISLAEFDRIDILVNNAGLASNCPLADMPLSLWLKVINTNLTGTFLCCKMVFPIMKAQGGGVIINMLGRGAHGGPVKQGLGAYSTTKAGLEAFTKVLALEAALHNIRVNSIDPGAGIATRMSLASTHSSDFSSLQPPGVVREAAMFLASDESRDFHGEYVNVQEWNRMHGIHIS